MQICELEKRWQQKASICFWENLSETVNAMCHESVSINLSCPCFAQNLKAGSPQRRKGHRNFPFFCGHDLNKDQRLGDADYRSTPDLPISNQRTPLQRLNVMSGGGDVGRWPASRTAY